MSLQRLAAAIRCDVRLQFRQGFYYAAALVAAVVVLAISQLPRVETDVGWLVPPIVTSNLTIGTFYFVGALVLLEKGEGSLEALVVTPLRDIEYLAAKVLTLSALSVVENVLIVAAFYGPRPGLGYFGLALGIALASVVLVLVGFVAVAAYDSMNEYLAPSVLYSGLASLPVFSWLLGWEHWLVLAHPLQAPMLLMRTVAAPIDGWQLAYGVLYPLVWLGLLVLWSLRSFKRFVTASAGAH